MDLKDYVGFKLITTIEANLDAEGRWKATHILRQSRKLTGNDWEHKQIEVTAINNDLDTAIGETMYSIAYYLDNIGGDLFDAEELKEEEGLIQ